MPVVDSVSTVSDASERPQHEDVHVEIDAADLFGESVDKELHPPSLQGNRVDIVHVDFAALFDESSVGTLIGLLKARDAETRKLVGSRRSYNSCR